ncbi:hypothetical protein [Brevibacillus nitrificans]|nr:hypothetical protein [Brevibacillus nitrificans]MDR7315275.1 hypothetical protein [Brevibacillus nitrificans]
MEPNRAEQPLAGNRNATCKRGAAATTFAFPRQWMRSGLCISQRA